MRFHPPLCICYSDTFVLSRVDIALAIGADGVHVGQTDMPAIKVREMLPAGAIIGVSANTVSEALAAVEDGADYIGIGPVWNTQTKKDAKNTIGVRGVGEIIHTLEGTNVKCVAIGMNVLLQLTSMS